MFQSIVKNEKVSIRSGILCCRRWYPLSAIPWRANKMPPRRITAITQQVAQVRSVRTTSARQSPVAPGSRFVSSVNGYSVKAGSSSTAQPYLIMTDLSFVAPVWTGDNTICGRGSHMCTAQRRSGISLPPRIVADYVYGRHQKVCGNHQHASNTTWVRRTFSPRSRYFSVLVRTGILKFPPRSRLPVSRSLLPSRFILVPRMYALA